MFLVVLFQVWHVREQDIAIERERSALNAQVYGDELEKDFARGISVTETLKAILVENGGEIKQFDTVAQELMEDYIGSIQIAPKGVVTDIYPLKGNEAGRIDLLSDPDRGPVSLYGRDQNLITMQGPFKLKQGGNGIAIRNPVYLRDEEGKQYFWGFTIVVIKSPEIYESTLHALETFGYDYYLETTKSPLSDDRAVIDSSVTDSKLLNDPVIHVFTVGGCTWALHVVPKGGWGLERTSTVVIGGFAFAVLLTVLSYLVAGLLSQRQQLKVYAQTVEDANEAKTTFLANMAHDIWTPMNSVMGLATLAEDHVAEPEKTQYYLEQIKVAGNQLTRIINNILEVSQIERDKLVHVESVTDMGEVLQNLKTVFESQMRAREIHLNFEEQVEHRYLYMDRAHLGEIFVNLFNNAMKYTPAGGAIEASFTELPGKDAEHVIIRSVIKDNGIGMTEEFQKELQRQFELEESEPIQGISGGGLGLSIVKRLVDMMHGTIQVESQANLGTKITVDLPHRIAEAPNDQIAAHENTDHALLKGKRFLIAEDDEINAMIIEELLQNKEILVDRVANGQECLDVLKMHSAGYYDLILMDLQMPVMDGYEATKAIRSLEDVKAKIPIVAMTANVFLEDRIKVIGAGMNAHVGKPVDLDALFATLYHVLADRDLYVDVTELSQFQKEYQSKGYPCGYFIYHDDAEQSLVYVDEATSVIFGYDHPGQFRKAMQNSFPNMIHPEDREEVLSEIDRQQEHAKDGIDRITYRIVRKDGKIRTVQDIGYKAMSGDELLYYVYIADITDEKHKRNK